MTLTFDEAVPIAAFAAVPGVVKSAALPDGRTVQLTVQGGLDGVVKAAAGYRLANFVSHEPSLEEIFLRYYSADGGSADQVDQQEGRRVA